MRSQVVGWHPLPLDPPLLPTAPQPGLLVPLAPSLACLSFQPPPLLTCLSAPHTVCPAARSRSMVSWLSITQPPWAASLTALVRDSRHPAGHTEGGITNRLGQAGSSRISSTIQAVAEFIVQAVAQAVWL